MPREQDRAYLERVPDDVPVFILVGYDALAPGTIGWWMDQAETAKAPEEKLKRAQEHLADIQRFQLAHPERVKVPD